MYYRLGHVEPLSSLKVGQVVKRGEKVATNGTGNGQWAAHCHFDIFKEEPTSWNNYVIGWAKAQVQNVYADPRGLEKIVMPTFDHLGYGWLEDAQYAGGHAYHSGLDLNGKGSGNADLGDPICSPVDGVVVHIHRGTDSNGGWGDLVIIMEIKNKDDNSSNNNAMSLEIPSKLKDEFSKYGLDVGDNLDKQDLDPLKDAMSDMRNKLTDCENNPKVVEKRVEVPVEKIVEKKVEVPVEKIVEKEVYPKECLDLGFFVICKPNKK